MDKNRWQRIQELFLAVESLSDQERHAYLEQVCPDPELRQEVLSLLVADDKAEEFLKPAIKPIAESNELTPGTVIGPYQIESLLGKGGMGSVYMAQDTRLHRPVALKFLSETFQQKAIYRERFLVEARAASRLDHVNICTIYDIGETDRSQPYIAMAYYAGDCLDSRIKRVSKHLGMEQSISIVSQILRGIQAAHEQGILHRDLKPANIIITDDHVAKILDFGVAKISGIDITTTGNQVGTIAYMSPEQLQGSEATPQVDVWSCGVILYELLTGQRPFVGKENHHVMYAILHKQFDVPQKVNPSIPDDIARIVERMLCHELELRYPSAQAVLVDLERLAGETTTGGTIVASDTGLTELDTVNVRTGSATTPTFTSDGDIRQATVMSVDLCHYAQLLQSLGPDNCSEIVSEFFKRMTQVVEMFGGSVSRIIDNTLIAIFGVPKAHGNDARRAVHAAFSCHKALRQLGDEKQHRLEAHIGIANGVVLLNNANATETTQLSITGDSLNLATRLDDLAQANEILISDSLYEIIKDHFDCERSGSVTTRHQKEPIEVWRVLSDAQQDGHAEHPIFGRTSETQQFSNLLSLVNETQRGHIIYICGEAGIGKTRLANEFKKLAQSSDYDTHQGLILDFGVSQAQGAVASVMRSLLGINPALNDEQIMFDSLVNNGQIQSNEVIYIKDLLGLGMTRDEQMLFDIMEHNARLNGLHETMVAIIARKAKTQALLLFFEDMHWADENTLNCITYIAANIQDIPVILLLTTRPENEPLTPAWRSQLNNTPLVSFYLSALHEQDATQMAKSLSSLETGNLKKLISRAQGNPLFLEQLIRNLDSHKSGEISDSSILPASLQSLVQAQLDNLETHDRYAARAASIIGQRFTCEQVRFLIDDPNYHCRNLIDHQLAHIRGPVYLFNHALIHEGIYASLLESHKQELHSRAADWFRERDKPLAAEHLDRANSPEAPATYLSAAIEQKSLYHFDTAIQLIDQALSITAQADQRFALHLLKGDVFSDTGEITHASHAYELALESATSDDQRCRAWIGLAHCHDINDEHDQVLSALEKAEAAAQQHKLIRELSQIHYQRGNLYFPKGDIEACRTEHQKAIEFAQQADSPQHEAQALSGLGDAEYAAGHMLSAHDYFSRCLALCKQFGYARIESANLFMLGTVRIYMNELDGALQDSLASANTANQVGHLRAEIVSRLTAGWILIEQNKLDEAMQQVETGLQLTEQLGAKRFEPFLNESKARILIAQGKKPEALVIAEKSMQIVRDTSSLQFIGPWVLSTLALASDDTALSQAALEEAAELLAGGCVGHNYYQFYRAAIEYSLQNEQWDLAEGYTNQLEDYTRDEPNPWANLHILWGHTLARAGQHPEAKIINTEINQLRQQVEKAEFYARIKTIDQIEKRCESIQTNPA